MQLPLHAKPEDFWSNVEARVFNFHLSSDLRPSGTGLLRRVPELVADVLPCRYDFL